MNMMATGRKICLLIFITGMLVTGFDARPQNNPSFRYKFSDEIDSLAVKDPLKMTLQSASFELSFIGLYKRALASFDLERTPGRYVNAKDSTRFVNSFSIQDARNSILEKAKTQQILIFNEAHYNPRNRVFVTSLLGDLKKMGYTYFAAETFDYSINSEPAPSINSGFYTREPQFGNMVRAAVAAGYVLYPYEVTTFIDGKQREITQASNIKKIFSTDPTAKVIVYCGFAHAYKGEMPTWGKTMAGRLKEFTNIDPFCIDQIILTESTDHEMEDGYYKIIKSRYHPTTYSVLVDQNGKLFADNQVDMKICYPPTKYTGNRPGWIFENNKSAFYIKPEEIKISFPVMVKAFNAGENINLMVPIDIIEIHDRNDLLQARVAVNKDKPTILVLSNRQGTQQIMKIER